MYNIGGKEVVKVAIETVPINWENVKWEKTVSLIIEGDGDGVIKLQTLLRMKSTKIIMNISILPDNRSRLVVDIPPVVIDTQTRISITQFISRSKLTINIQS